MAKTPHQTSGPRDLGDLKKTLEEHRSVLSREVAVRMRDVRAAGERPRLAGVTEEFAPKDIQDDVDLALIEMNAETLGKIETALRLLEDGRYGTCVECGGAIARVRLRALPFALRCSVCQDAHEQRRPLPRRATTVRLEERGPGD